MTDDLAECRALLPTVSRTFALTIPALPGPLADAVGVAYLLCRIADTIEDRADLPDDVRREAFASLARILRDPEDTCEIDRFLESWPQGADPADERLVRALPAVCRALRAMPGRDLVVACALEMVAGMDETSRRPIVAGVRYASDDLDGLERYCHFVAGTVGVMLTRLFDQHLGGGFATPARLEQGRRFGLGLQLTNVLRDHPEDLGRGASFVPRAWLDGPRIRPAALAEGIGRALAHLDEAHAYALALPADPAGMRLFCLWSAWLAAATLREVAADPHGLPKVPRDVVTGIVASANDAVADDRALTGRWAALRQEVRA